MQYSYSYIVSCTPHTYMNTCSLHVNPQDLTSLSLFSSYLTSFMTGHYYLFLRLQKCSQ